MVHHIPVGSITAMLTATAGATATMALRLPMTRSLTSMATRTCV